MPLLIIQLPDFPTVSRTQREQILQRLAGMVVRYRVFLSASILTAVMLCSPTSVVAGSAAGPQAATSAVGARKHGSLTDRSISMPDADQWRRVLTLRDHNTRVVVFGTSLLGLAAGTIGSFTLLRRRALMGDALSHATLPGVGLAFILAPSFGLEGKSLPVLLTGAAVSGLAGVASILFIRNLTRLKEDAALGIVLSVFFGAGVALLSVVQQMPNGHAAGLEAFIYGKTASMIVSDAWMIGVSGIVCVAVAAMVFKEITLLCFDEGFAGSRGFPVIGLDVILMAMVVIVTIIGLQAVGLVLMIALLVIPAAAARFWTHNMKRMTVISAVLGAGSGMIGSGMSALFPRLPSGAMIVLVSGLMFFVSMLAGPARGVAVRLFRRWTLNRDVDRQHLLRGLYEFLESRGLIGHGQAATTISVPLTEILAMRSWSPARLNRQIRRSQRTHDVKVSPDRSVALTDTGTTEAAKLVHQHRLWELYLITHADIAPSHVDRSADAIEHVLDPEMIDRLEALLHKRRTEQGIAASPHPIHEVRFSDDELPGGRESAAGQTSAGQTSAGQPTACQPTAAPPDSNHSEGGLR